MDDFAQNFVIDYEERKNMPKARPRNPMVGDIHYLGKMEGKVVSIKEITNFEVWDGTRWVHASENPIYNIQQEDILDKRSSNDRS